MARTMLDPSQINLRKLFSVEGVLRSRGYEVSENSSFKTTLLEKEDPDEAILDQLFECFSDRQNRIDILRAIENKSDLKPEILIKFPLLKFPKLDRTLFSVTLEWYLGELLVRKFRSFSSAFGVKIKGLTNSENVSDIGDFDTLSVMGDTSLVYIECKSGATNLEQICLAARRGRLIGANSTIVALDSQTGTYQKLKSLLENEQHPNFSLKTNVFEIESIGLPDSRAVVWADILFLPLASKSIENSLATVLRLDHHVRVESYHTAIYTSPFTEETKSVFQNRGFDISF